MCHTPREGRRAAHLPFRGRTPARANTTVVRNAWPVQCQTYGYLHELCWHQINTAW